MNMEIIEKIAKSLNKAETDEEAHAYFPDNSYKTFKIEKNNFHEIKEPSINSKLCFIDGGNTELLQSANNSLQLIRIYYTIYNGNKRIKSKKFEFLALISTEQENNKVFYKAKLFDNIINIDEKDLIFDPFDNTIKTGIHQTRISKIGGIVRRFSELKVAETIVSELEKEDIIILDGFLQSSVTNESKYMESLYKKAEEKGITISGLSKTTTLLATNGNSILNTLNKIAPKTNWYYHPVAEINNKDHKAEIFFIKLHEKSKYVFRFELYKNQEYNINNIISLLTANSKDPVFLGYPYGLIEADRFARVSNQEKAYIQTILKTRIKEWDNINNLDAHDILDNIG